VKVWTEGFKGVGVWSGAFGGGIPEGEESGLKDGRTYCFGGRVFRKNVWKGGLRQKGAFGTGTKAWKGEVLRRPRTLICEEKKTLPAEAKDCSKGAELFWGIGDEAAGVQGERTNPPGEEKKKKRFSGAARGAKTSRKWAREGLGRKATENSPPSWGES